MKKMLAILLSLMLLVTAGLADGLNRPTGNDPAKEAAAPGPADLFVNGYARANGIIYAESALQTDFAYATNALVYVLAWRVNADGTASATVRFASASGQVYAGCTPASVLVPLADTVAAGLLESAEHPVQDGKIKLASDGIRMFWEAEEEIAAPVEIVILEQPQDQTAEAGTMAVFAVLAEETEGMLWQWQALAPDGIWANALHVGSQTREMTVPATPELNGYRYRCVVTDAAGNTGISSEALLTVLAPAEPADPDLEPLAILVQPEDVTVASGEKASFEVAVNREDVRYQWQTQLVNTEEWRDTSLDGNTEAVLSFSAKKGFNQRMYRCIVTDSEGNTVTSDPALLTVTAK